MKRIVDLPPGLRRIANVVAVMPLIYVAASFMVVWSACASATREFHRELSQGFRLLHQAVIETLQQARGVDAADVGLRGLARSPQIRRSI